MPPDPRVLLAAPGTAPARGATPRVGTVGPVGTAAVMRRLARWALGAVIVLSPVRAQVVLVARPIGQVYGGYTDIVLSASDVAVLLTLGLWLASLVLQPRTLSFGPAFLRWPLVALLLLVWVGVPSSVDPTLTAYNGVRLVLLAALALYVHNEIDRIARLAGPLAVMIAIQAVVGIGQVVSQRSLGLGLLGELGLDPLVRGTSVVVSAGGERLLRAYGLSDHPNILGGLLAFALLLLAVGLGRARAAQLMTGSVVWALGALALLLTFSRAAWASLAVGLVVAVAMLARRRDRPALRRWIGVSLGAGLVCAAFLAPYARFLAVRAELPNDPVPAEVMSLGGRSVLARLTNEVFVAHPLLGVGLGGLPEAMLTADRALPIDYQPAHLVLLDAAAEIGVFGALSYAVVLIAPWIALWRQRARWTRELAGASAALAAISVVGLFDYYTWTFSPGRIWAWLLLGLWATAYSSARLGSADA